MNNTSNNKRKRNRRSGNSLSSESSVSSVSSGDETDDPLYKSPTANRKGSKKKKKKNKSVFSGFWSDGEIVDDKDEDDKENNKRGKRKKTANNNKGTVDYEGFYLTIGDTVYEIGVGDVVAMRNAFEDETSTEEEDDEDEDDSTNKNDAAEDSDNGEDGTNNSRELRRKRRMERMANAEEELPSPLRLLGQQRRTAPAPSTAAAPVTKQEPQPMAVLSSSDYQADAMSDKPSDYYRAVPSASERANTSDATMGGSTTAADAATADDPNDKATPTTSADAGAGATSAVADAGASATVDASADNAPNDNDTTNSNMASAMVGKDTEPPNDKSASGGAKQPTQVEIKQESIDVAMADANAIEPLVPTDSTTRKALSVPGQQEELPSSSSTGVAQQPSEPQPASAEAATAPQETAATVAAATATPPTHTVPEPPQAQPPQPPPPPPLPPLKEAKQGDGLMLARVERIWREAPHKHRRTSTSSGSRSSSSKTEGKVLFQARWFLKKEDVDSLPLGELTGPVASHEFSSTITEHDLVLSNQSDDNHVTTICDLIQVLYRNPDLDTAMPSHVLPATYLCRYSLRIDDDSRVVVLPYTGENDDWKEMTVSALNSKKRSVDDSSKNNNTSSVTGSPGQFMHNLLTPRQSGRRNSNASAGITASAQRRRRVGDFANADEGIDEGATLQRDIEVGPDHQVSVPKFDPSKAATAAQIVSRKPIAMWKPEQISQEGTDDYIERAAQILTPYLRKHHLTQEEPYAPFPTKRMEELSKSLSRKRLPTLSSVSSVSSLTTHTVDALREFNVDALLRNLHVSNYNITAAIAAIEASPMDYLVAWSPHEKARFNVGFRRYSGSLRAIYKGMGGDKALPEVIDYHYRFKIPDQFRKVQERKREQAIRMLECIETRRVLNAPIVVSTGIATGRSTGGSEKTKEKGDWTKTSSSSLTGSLEERRVMAKELLLDVEAKLGRNKMMKVFEVFKQADETTLTECKTKLLEIFRGHQDFQSRFLEFLPQQLRL